MQHFTRWHTDDGDANMSNSSTLSEAVYSRHGQRTTTPRPRHSNGAHKTLKTKKTDVRFALGLQRVFQRIFQRKQFDLNDILLYGCCWVIQRETFDLDEAFSSEAGGPKDLHCRVEDSSSFSLTTRWSA